MNKAFKIGIWTFILLVFILKITSAATLASTYELIGCWPLNESSGNAYNYYNGTSTATVTYSSLDGVITNARGFGYTNVGEIDTQLGNNFSVDVWFYVGSFPGSNSAGILSKFGASTDISYTMKTDVNRDIGFGVKNTGGTELYAQWTTTLNTSQWYHVVGVYNTTHLILYVNGVKKAVTAQTGSVYNSASTVPTVIGRAQRTNHFTLQGREDEARIWDGVLTDGGCAIDTQCGGAVAKLWNNTKGVSCDYVVHVDQAGPTTMTPTPTSLTNTSNGFTNITLAWSGSYGSNYLIYRNGTNVANDTVSPYTDIGLSVLTRYGYQVKAYNGTYTIPLSNFSNKIEVFTKNATRTPTPTGLTNTSNGITNITLSWNGNYGSKYLIYRNGTNVANDTVSPYTDVSLTNNTRYGYQIAAHNTSYQIQTSTISSKIEVRTKQTTQAVSALSVSLLKPLNMTNQTTPMTMNFSALSNGTMNNTLEIHQRISNSTTLTGITLGYSASYDPFNHSVWMANNSDTDPYPGSYLEEYDAYTLEKTGKNLPQPHGTEDCAFNQYTKRFNCIHNPAGVVKIMDKAGVNYTNVSIGVAGAQQGIDVNSDGNWTVCVSGTRYKFDSDTGTQLSTGAIGSCTCDGVAVRIGENGKDDSYWVACDGNSGNPGVRKFTTGWVDTGFEIALISESNGVEGIDFHENMCTLYITFDDHAPGTANGFYVRNICDPLISNETKVLTSGVTSYYNPIWGNLTINAMYKWYYKYYSTAGQSATSGLYNFSVIEQPATPGGVMSRSVSIIIKMIEEVW